jgi:hypothetical protein
VSDKLQTEVQNPHKSVLTLYESSKFKNATGLEIKQKFLSGGIEGGNGFFKHFKPNCKLNYYNPFGSII